MQTIYRCWHDLCCYSPQALLNICIITGFDCGTSKFNTYRPAVLRNWQTLNSVGSAAPMRPLSPPPPYGQRVPASQHCSVQPWTSSVHPVADDLRYNLENMHTAETDNSQCHGQRIKEISKEMLFLLRMHTQIVWRKQCKRKYGNRRTSENRHRASFTTASMVSPAN